MIINIFIEKTVRFCKNCKISVYLPIHMELIRNLIRFLLPRPILNVFLPYYHYLLALTAAYYYGQPSRNLKVIAVTGTKGKSSVTELITHILETDGKKVASLSTIQFKIDDKIKRNLYKMTMPGRFFVQKFLYQAVEAGCEYAIIEMTSEGAKQYRHRFIALDALIFTNLTPEHIESHGSFENYKSAKLSLAKAVENSPKRPRKLVANTDDPHGQDFLNFAVEEKLPYSLKDLSLFTLHKDGVSLVFGDLTIRTPLIGKFNVYNALAAITLCKSYGVSMDTIEKALRSQPPIKGRVEQFTSPQNASKKVTAVVDYAHTPDSLEKFYQAFPDSYKVCVLGNTGGGRDRWKRPEMAEIAERYCDYVILTNEDPYDEDPEKIIAEMANGITDTNKLSVIIDRKEAINTAVSMAPDHGHVLVTGKGTDPYIMGPNGTKISWSDAEVVKNALDKLPKVATSEVAEN